MRKKIVIVLAAGLGTRMKSSLPKVMHSVGGKVLIEHVVTSVLKLKPDKIIMVVSPEYQQIQSHFLAKGMASIEYVVQKQRLGTGHAVKTAVDTLTDQAADVFVVNGDMPFVRVESLKTLYRVYAKAKVQAAVLSAKLDEPFGFGRIVRSAKACVLDIVEEKDASAEQKKIQEVSTGCYVFDLGFLKKFIGKIKTHNKQKEYYLPDIVKLGQRNRAVIAVALLKDSFESSGINTQKDLHVLNELFYARQRNVFMQKGVTLMGQDIFIDADVALSAGVVLEAPCFLKGKTSLGTQTVVETGCVIKDSHIGNNVVVKAHCYLDQAKVENLCQLGPFAHLRPKAHLKEKAKAGNFVEIKKSVIGKGSKVNHLSYIGDADIGTLVNVGAGTITCNYDGKHKYKTILKDRVFVGSDTQFVAPVTVGHDAVVGAGTTVTKNVNPNSLVISRVYQKEIKNWVRKRQKNT